MLTKTDNLIKTDQKLFHMGDLAVLWGIDNSNTLRKTVSRYTKRGVLNPIYRGFYSKLPFSQIDPYDLGSRALNTYCYVSLETILARNGVISQEPVSITFIASKKRAFELLGRSYTASKLSEIALFNSEGVIRVKDHFEATLERAVADTLFLDPTYYFDLPNRINWDRVKEIQRKVRYK